MTDRTSDRREFLKTTGIAFTAAGPLAAWADSARAQESDAVAAASHLGAIRLPVGGMGAGCIHINGRAERELWQIFNNQTQAVVPHSFLAVRAQTEQSEPVVRALQTKSVGPFPAMQALSFSGEYPFGWFHFEDAQLPVSVSLETFNPMIPLEAKDSAIPCAIFNVTVTNSDERCAQISILATQQNAVGFKGHGGIDVRSHGEYGRNQNQLVSKSGATFLHMTKTEQPEQGDMVLAVLDSNVTAAASFESLQALHKEFESGGKLSGPQNAPPSATGRTHDGALAASFSLEKGQQRTVTFMLTWHFPDASQGSGKWGGKGNMYANWWANALDVAGYLQTHLDDLTNRTRLYHDTVYASNLPHWLLDRITSQTAILKSRTCFWTADGYFGGWEGLSPGGGCCGGSCTHVWQYAQAHARLFPSIGRRMREQDFQYQDEQGGFAHRHPDADPAFDGQCGTILGAYREHLCSADRTWLDTHWAKIKRGIEYLIHRWDKDENGILAGAQWNTLDDNLSGSTSWLGTLYLACLAAGEKMAQLQNDAAFAQRCRRIRLAGAQRQNETLWNGDYYIQIPDPQPQRDYRTGCHIDQLLGQWWAHQLDLGWLYPPDRVRRALLSLHRHNFKANFHGIRQVPRKFVDDDDGGMQMITWPQGDRPPREHTMKYADEVMTGFEYAAAANLIAAGLLREGFSIVRAVYDRYDGRLRTGLTLGNYGSWGCSGNPFGDDECGKFYARALSVWSVLLACQGFVYDGPAGVIGFRPLWRSHDHRSFFTASQGWGLFTQKRNDNCQTEQIELKYGQLRVNTLVFELPAGKKLKRAAVTVAGNNISAAAQQSDRGVTLTLQEPLTLQADQEIQAVLEFAV